MKQYLAAFLKNESGATAIEYALIAGGIFVVIVGTVNVLGGNVDGLFQQVSDGFN